VDQRLEDIGSGCVVAAAEAARSGVAPARELVDATVVT
jgi:hypothetical protein